MEGTSSPEVACRIDCSTHGEVRHTAGQPCGDLDIGSAGEDLVLLHQHGEEDQTLDALMEVLSLQTNYSSRVAHVEEPSEAGSNLEEEAHWAFQEALGTEADALHPVVAVRSEMNRNRMEEEAVRIASPCATSYLRPSSNSLCWTIS